MELSLIILIALVAFLGGVVLIASASSFVCIHGKKGNVLSIEYEGKVYILRELHEEAKNA